MAGKSSMAKAMKKPPCGPMQLKKKKDFPTTLKVTLLTRCTVSKEEQSSSPYMSLLSITFVLLF